MFFSLLVKVPEQQTMDCFCVAPDAKQVAKTKTKTKTRTLCSMCIFRGYQRDWFIPRPGPCAYRPGPYGGPEMRDGQLFMPGPYGEYAVHEVWVRCKGYCQRGLDICAVHEKSRMRQHAAAATLIQSITRSNRAKKLVALRGAMPQAPPPPPPPPSPPSPPQPRPPLNRLGCGCFPCAPKGSR